MGYGTFDSTASAARSAFRSSTGTSAFVHTAAVASGAVAAKTHDSLNLALKPTRECRDNADNPVSVPIAVFVDVTGSMHGIGNLIIDDLNKVVKMIQEKGVVPHPSLLFGAVGDANSDRAPLQVGEFESDDVLAEKHLGNIYKEGNGGGNDHESYDLVCFAVANQFQTDHWDKRGEKGFLFIIGDEPITSVSRKDFIKQHCGVEVGQDVSMETTAELLQEKWNVFVLRPGGTMHFNSERAHKSWTTYFPEERVIKVQDWNEINGMIAGTISVMSGMSVDDAIAAMEDSGLKAGSSSTALAQVATSANLVATGGADLATSDPGASTAVRL